VFLFIGERPSGWAIVGGAIIIASVIVHTIMATRSKAARRITADLTAHE
jgi:drug/metabolite transporter (DMT)-like permease